MAVLRRPAIAVLSCLAVFLAGMAMSGCSFILGLEPLRVIDWRPNLPRVLTPPAAGGIWVEFSVDMDRVKAEQAFSLSENGSTVPGTFTWTGNRLVFTPSRPVAAGNDYEMAVLVSAESTQGNSLPKDFRFAFTTKSESGRPTVVSVQPADGSRVIVPFLPVTVTFSEPVDQASFLSAFSISPDPGGAVSFDPAGSTATFTPLSPWQPGTTYALSVSDGLEDLSGNRLAAALRSRFTAGADDVRPALLAVRPTVNAVPQGSGLSPEDTTDAVQQVNGGFECTWGLELQFSEPVARENIESFIDIQPAWAYEIDPSIAPRDRYLLVPKDRFRWGTLYALAVKRGVRDTDGNTSAADALYFVKADGAATRPPTVEHLRFRTNPADPPASAAYADYTPSDVYANLDLSAIVPGATAVTSSFDLYLRLASGAAIDPFSFMKAFSATATNGAAILTPVSVAVSGFADPQPADLAGLTPVRVYVSVTNTTESGVITLGLADSFTDTAGNALGTAFSLPLLK
jgi:hypothetical protein